MKSSMYCKKRAKNKKKTKTAIILSYLILSYPILHRVQVALFLPTAVCPLPTLEATKRCRGFEGQGGG